MVNTSEEFATAYRYHTAGQHSLAEQFYEVVLARDPNHADALHMLGVLAQQKGNPAQAIDLMTRALAGNGHNPAIWNNLGVAHTTAGNLREAVAAYEEALRLRPDYAAAYNNLGIAWQQLGKIETAVACFEKALRYLPSYAEAYNSLGQARKAQGKLAEALAAFEQALRLKPDYAEAANNLGILLHEQEDLEQAMTYYRQALRLNPGYADASNNLATALKEQGFLDEAIVQYRQTLRMKPEHVLAYYNLSQFAAEGRYFFEPEELARIKAIVASGRGSALEMERSLFCFTLATVLDKQGSYDEAFGYYKQANDLRKHFLQERGQAFDAPEHRAFVNRLTDTFNLAYFERVRAWGIDTEMPIFVIGMPRTGTTLVEQILASHPRVFGAGELGELPRLLAAQARAAGHADPYHVSLPIHDQEAARNLADAYLQLIAKLGKGAARVTIKTLENYLHLGMIATLFPKARLIFCRRDPIDVCLSCYFQNFQNQSFSWSLDDIAAYYRSHEKLMSHWRQVLPMAVHEVRYEDLIHHQETVTRKMLDFCGLGWDEHCLTFFNTRRVVRTASTLQVRKPISTQSIGRWKNYRSHLEPLLKALGLCGDSEAYSQAIGSFATNEPPRNLSVGI